MSKQALAYCWCDMCGYNAKVTSDAHIGEIETQGECPDCEEAGMFSLLSLGEVLPEHIAEDENMPTYPNRTTP